MERVFGDSERIYPATAAVLLAVERTAPLLSPAYWRVADETELRSMWRERRAELDREFDAHINTIGPVRIESGGERGSR